MLEQVEEWINEESKYLKFKDGEQRTLAFDPTKVTITEMPGFKDGKPRKVANFTVRDQAGFGNEQIWTVGKTWATEIKKHIDNDVFVLNVKRNGTGLKTTYTFTPAQAS